MTNTTVHSYIDYLQERGEGIVPAELLATFREDDSATSRAMLARFLFHFSEADDKKMKQNAFKLLLPLEFDNDGETLQQWMDLSLWSWVLRQSAAESMSFAQRAYELVQTLSDDALGLVTRGFVHFNYWTLLTRLGCEAEALAESKAVIDASETAAPSMEFFARLFVVNVAMNKEEWENVATALSELTNIELDLQVSLEENIDAMLARVQQVAEDNQWPVPIAR